MSHDTMVILKNDHQEMRRLVSALTHPAEHAPAPTQAIDDTPDQADGAADAALADDPLPSPVPAPSVDPIRSDHGYPVNDPCIYLG